MSTDSLRPVGSPHESYTLTRSEGLVHIHPRARPDECVGCIERGLFEVVSEMIRRQALAEFAAAVKKATV